MNHYTMRLLTTLFLCICISASILYAQTDDAPRGLTVEEYKMAQEVTIDDLDNETYVKVGEGDYVLDRYEMKPAYFITGDSGVKKRLDLYKLMDRNSMSELGLVVFFTNTESKETFNLVIPNLASTGEVWNMYFDDIHQHDREEEDVALKMSYVLSKEVAYLLQKSSGVDVSAMEQGNSDYDFCFPGTALVTLADGNQKPIAEVAVGDQLVGYEDNQYQIVEVEEVQIHQKASIPLASAQLVPVEEVTASTGSFSMEVVQLIATPNHPLLTAHGTKALENLMVGEQVYRYEAATGNFVAYRVAQLNHAYDAATEVYNLETSGSTYLINEFVVLEK